MDYIEYFDNILLIISYEQMGFVHDEYFTSEAPATFVRHTYKIIAK